MDNLTSDQVLADIAREARSTSSKKYIEAKNLATDTVFPLLETIVQWVAEELEEVTEAIDSLLEEGEVELVPSDLAIKLIGFLNLTLAVLEKVQVPTDDGTLEEVAALKAAVPELVQEVIESSDLGDHVDYEGALEEDSEDPQELDEE